MTHEHPYTKLSRLLGAAGKLQDLNHGKAALLWLYFVTEQGEDDIVEAPYSQMMQATGIGSPSTIAGLIDHLEACGLIARLEANPETGSGRYLMLGDWARYKAGAPEGDGTTETVVPEEPTTETVEGGTTETVDTLIESVVVDSPRDRSDSDSESVQQQSLRATTETVVGGTTETVVPLDPRLHSLQLPVTDDQWRGLVARHGQDAVVRCARWYHYAHREGLANGVGWLFTALRDGWATPPAGFDEKHYWTDEERARRWQEQAERYGVE